MVLRFMIYLLTAIGLSPGGSSTDTFTHKQYTEQQNNLGEGRPCPVLASYTLTFALQVRKNSEKPQSG